ncbi:MAG: methyltransferase, TIGR04325 family, partial [Planctomycetes bacterium]|nr:methyltransferase, TIGR04325 family [Planctomycetota bacterium]
AATWWGGDYPDWDAASREAGGYDAGAILERVSASTRRVLAGEAAFERDSVCFAQPETRWPLLASLLLCAARSGGQLRVLDFGGSLGSAWLQHREPLRQLAAVDWRVVEQPAFVARGRELHPSGPLSFHASIDDALAAGPIDVLLLGSVLQYLREPYAFIAECRMRGFAQVIIDRTPVIAGGRDRLVVQRVTRRIYPASYPCWLFDPAHLRSAWLPDYRAVWDIPCDDRGNLGIAFTGALYERAAGPP